MDTVSMLVEDAAASQFAYRNVVCTKQICALDGRTDGRTDGQITIQLRRRAS